MYSRNKEQLKSELHTKQRGICAFCRESITRLNGHSASSATIDHITPRSEGGKNGRYNLQLMHRNCNFIRNINSLVEQGRISDAEGMVIITKLRANLNQALSAFKAKMEGK